jgi:hypothetical protein
MTYMRLSRVLSTGDKPEHPNLNAPRYEFVTIQADLFDFRHGYLNFSDVRQRENIVDFP